MSWSGSGTITKSPRAIEVNILASPQTNTPDAQTKSTAQIEMAKQAAKSIVESPCYDAGEYGVTISGHAHSEGDSKDSCSVSLYGK